MDKTIGTFEDLQHDQVINFVYSDDMHRIMRSKVDDARASLVLEWNGLDFREDEKITGIGVVDDLLTWTNGRGEIKQINMTRRLFYDTIKDTDPFFANLIKRPPLVAALADKKTEASSLAPNYIHDDTFQITYRYVYLDEEKSVFAPYSAVVTFEYQGQNRDTKQKINVHLPIGFPPINSLVKRVEFAVKRATQTGLYIIKKFDLPVTGNPLFSFDYDNSYTGEIVPDEEATRLFDNVPLDAKALTVARNRIFVANYAEGYDDLGTVNMTITPVMGLREYGRPLWKSNSTTRFGIEFVDYAGRSMGVVSQPEWGITFGDFDPGENIQVPLVATVQLNFSRPPWARAWHLVRTENLKYSFFLQGLGHIIYRIKIKDTTYDLQFPALNETINITNEALFVEIGSLDKRNVGYVFEKGDMINIAYTKFNVNPPFERLGTRKFNNVPILGQQGNFLEIPLNTGFFNLEDTAYNATDAMIFEIFRPHQRTNADKFYRTPYSGVMGDETEFTETVTVPGDAWLIENKQKNFRKYDRINDQGIDIHLEWNTDTWIVKYPWMEAMSPFDAHYDKWAVSLGQPTAILPTNLQKRVEKPNFERFSNKYLSGTQVNGLTSFEAFNEKELPRENGPIQKILLASNTQSEGSVMLAIAQNETESQYIGEVQFKDTQGQTTVAISDQVIGSTNTLRGGFGTLNPESVAHHNGRIYFWDVTKGEPVRYSADGLTPLATQHNMRDFFREVARKQQALGDRVKVYGGYYPEKDEYVLTFETLRGGVVPFSFPQEDNFAIMTVPIQTGILFQGFTVAFSESVKGFSTFYSFQPEFYAKSNTRFFSFVEGKFYLHGGRTALHNNFYGTQYVSKVRPVYNQQPDSPKIWHSTVVEGKEKWVATEIKNELGQASRISPNWYEKREGVFYAPIKRDLNSKGFVEPGRALNNGNVMRSQWLEVLFENNATLQTRLDRIALTYIESMGHTEIR